jgi:hypothetical protein
MCWDEMPRTDRTRNQVLLVILHARHGHVGSSTTAGHVQPDGDVWQRGALNLLHRARRSILHGQRVLALKPRRALLPAKQYGITLKPTTKSQRERCLGSSQSHSPRASQSHPEPARATQVLLQSQPEPPRATQSHPEPARASQSQLEPARGSHIRELARVPHMRELARPAWCSSRRGQSGALPEPPRASQSQPEPARAA